MNGDGVLRRFHAPAASKGNRKGREIVERVCDICGVPYQILAKIFNRGQSLTCSVECRKAKRPQSGPGTPNWKGGISKFPYRYRLRQKEAHPEKVAAREAVRSAVRSGKLVRKPCVECGSTEKIHGHHTNYSKPLKVVWLCAKHHRIAHGGTR